MILKKHAWPDKNPMKIVGVGSLRYVVDADMDMGQQSMSMCWMAEGATLRVWMSFGTQMEEELDEGKEFCCFRCGVG